MRNTQHHSVAGGENMVTAYDVARKELTYCSASDPVSKVADTLQKKNISSVFVEDLTGETLGIITVGDILRMVSNKANFTTTAAKIASPLKGVVDKDTPAEEMRTLFQKYGVTRIPLKDSGGKIVGVVRDKDLDRILRYSRAQRMVSTKRYRHE